MNEPARRAIGGYVLEGILGQGGMGAVYRARDARTGRLVALKVLLGGAKLDDAQRRRFAREAELLARIRSPEIVAVHAAGEDPRAGPWFVMDLVAGEPLARRIGRGPLDPREAARIAAGIARGLGALHAAGIVHRDVKPENVLVGERGPVLVDLGVGKDLAASVALTRSRALVGTALYLPPEALGGAAGAPVGPASDVWSAGAVLHEMLAGEPTFGGATVIEIFARIVEQEAPRLPGAPAALAAIVARCLAKAPADRYPDGAALARDLDAFLEGRAPAALLERARTRGRRRLVAAGGLALLVIAGVLVARSRRPREDSRPETPSAEARLRAESARAFDELAPPADRARSLEVRARLAPLLAAVASARGRAADDARAVADAALLRAARALRDTREVQRLASELATSEGDPRVRLARAEELVDRHEDRTALELLERATAPSPGELLLRADLRLSHADPERAHADLRRAGLSLADAIARERALLHETRVRGVLVEDDPEHPGFRRVTGWRKLVTFSAPAARIAAFDAAEWVSRLEELVAQEGGLLALRPIAPFRIEEVAKPAEELGVEVWNDATLRPRSSQLDAWMPGLAAGDLGQPFAFAIAGSLLSRAGVGWQGPSWDLVLAAYWRERASGLLVLDGTPTGSRADLDALVARAVDRAGPQGLAGSLDRDPDVPGHLLRLLTADGWESLVRGLRRIAELAPERRDAMDDLEGRLGLVLAALPPPAGESWWDRAFAEGLPVLEPGPEGGHRLEAYASVVSSPSKDVLAPRVIVEPAGATAEAIRLRVLARVAGDGLQVTGRSRVVLALDGHVRRLRGRVALDAEEPFGRARFIVESEGTRLRETPFLTGRSAAQELAVELPAGARSVGLLTEQLDPLGKEPSRNAQPTWLDLAFVRDDGSTVRFDGTGILEEQHTWHEPLWGAATLYGRIMSHFEARRPERMDALVDGVAVEPREARGAEGETLVELPWSGARGVHTVSVRIELGGDAGSLVYRRRLAVETP